MIAYSGERAGSPPYERREGLDWNVAGDSIVGKETWDVIQPLSATLRGAVRYGLPAGLADGLELRSVRRSPRDRL